MESARSYNLAFTDIGFAEKHIRESTDFIFDLREKMINDNLQKSDFKWLLSGSVHMQGGRVVLSGYIYFCIFSGNSCILQQKSGTMGADRQYIDTGEPAALTGL